VIRRKGGTRHGGCSRFVWMLNERLAAMLLDCSQSGSAVAIAPTQNNADDPPPVDFGGGQEQGIGCGAGVVDLRSLVQSDMGELQKHVMVWRRDVDACFLDPFRLWIPGLD
jgi:hypothetical protein